MGVLLATGAGTDQDHPQMAGLRTRLAEAGLMVMTFDYAYRAQGRSFPDRAPALLEVHGAAARHLRQIVGGDCLVLAGRSMGGRMSTMLAAGGEPCRCVVAYGYPLHPAGEPHRLRVEHLSALPVPTLMLTGTRDELALPDLVDAHLRPLSMVTLDLVEGADHSFRRPGTSVAGMLDLLVSRTTRWLKEVPGLGVMLADPP